MEVRGWSGEDERRVCGSRAGTPLISYYAISFPNSSRICPLRHVPADRCPPSCPATWTSACCSGWGRWGLTSTCSDPHCAEGRSRGRTGPPGGGGSGGGGGWLIVGRRRWRGLQGSQIWRVRARGESGGRTRNKEWVGETGEGNESMRCHRISVIIYVFLQLIIRTHQLSLTSSSLALT